MNDPYDNGTPKYATASDIYEALCDLVAAEEEIGILSEMFEDVSWDGQSYYYIDGGTKLKERFDTMTEYGNKDWIMDLAIWQLEEKEIHGLVYDALCDEDLAKRIGFKAIFIDHMCRGYKQYYEKISDAFREELHELNRFDRYETMMAYYRAMESLDMPVYASPYDGFCDALIKKVNGLQLHKEKTLISECRALLTSYDDFIFGLRVNQQLHTDLEKRFANKVAALQEEFDRRLALLATAAGLQPAQLLALESGEEPIVVLEVTQ